MHLALVKKTRETSTKQRHLETASKYISEADRIHDQYEPTAIVKANLLLLRMKPEKALEIFENILKKRSNCVPALVGLAKIHMAYRRHHEALMNFQKAILYCKSPIAGAEIRFGISRCFAQLGMNKEAKAALTRCVQTGYLDGSTCLALMAIIELNESKDLERDFAARETSLGDALKHLSEAFKSERHHPVVLNLIANHCHMMGQPDKSINSYLLSSHKSMQYAQDALNHTTSNSSIRAEALFQIGRVHHIKQNYEEARLFYEQCLELEPEHLRGQYNVGQMYLQNGDFERAIRTFKKLNDKFSVIDDIPRMLGTAYSMSGKTDEALAVFDSIIEYTTQNCMFSVQVGRLYEDTDLRRALKCNVVDALLWYAFNMLNVLLDYENFVVRRQSLDDDDAEAKYADRIKVEVLNNLGALYHATEDYDKAITYYTAALREYKEAHDGKEVLPEDDIGISMTYNLARAYEEKAEWENARNLYLRIIHDCPDYFEARLRLGALEFRKGRIDEAVQQYQIVADADKKNTLAWAMIAQAEAVNNTKLCKRALEKILRECDKDDIYAHVALGNYHAAAAKEAKTGKQATNGMGMMLAEEGQYAAAHDLFTRIRENIPREPSVLVNIGHTFCEQKRYDDAIAMYEHAQRLIGKPDFELHLYLSRALYFRSKETHRLQDLDRAVHYAERAFRLCPKAKSTLYNIALLKQAYCQTLLDKHKPTTRQIKDSFKRIHTSQRLFRFLKDSYTEKDAVIDRKIAEQRYQYGLTILAQMERKLEESGEQQNNGQLGKRNPEINGTGDSKRQKLASASDL
ncbi:hypothetical protein BX666DRAFT_1874773 [Dichotomocladium elegans]|nr:hypothetical protein BX666DRAFT_1874773 [Dichotomocladium elegans]